MSKSIAIVSTSAAAAALVQAASAMISKVTNNAVQATSATAIAGNSVVVGAETPAGVHTVITKPIANVGKNGPYAGVSAVFVRSVLPRSAPDTLQPKDKLDVYASAGMSTAAEVEIIKASVVKSAKVATEQAKAMGAKKVSLVVKQVTKYTQLNQVFIEAATQAIEGAGLAVDIQGTAQATNQLLMFPETASVVLACDTPNCEDIELAYAGALGGVCRTLVGDSGVVGTAGHSHKSIALAVAEQLRALGMPGEAACLEASVVPEKAN